MLRTIISMALGAAFYGSPAANNVTGSVNFSVEVLQTGQVSINTIGDVAIVDMLAFGERYHKAHIINGDEVFSAGVAGFSVKNSETVLALK